MRLLPVTTSAGLALCVALSLAPRAQAQAAQKAEKVKFDTVDGVELHGSYWPSSKGRKAPVALLLHRYGGKISEDGWDHLAEELQKKGFAVLGFDFRGHGNSTDVEKTFWTMYGYNRQLVSSYKAADPPKTIAFKDFKQAYAPYLLNDVAAAKAYLERRNDNGECNVSNLVVIGAEEGAALGLAWVGSEGLRFRVKDPRTGERQEKPEDRDVVGCVWLSMSNKFSPNYSPPSNTISNWLKEVGKEKKVPMAFLYGAGNDNEDKAALSYIKTLKPGYKRDKKNEDDELPESVEEGVPSTNLVGHRLLNNKLVTAQGITAYLEKKVLEKNGNREWEKRELDETAFAWAKGNRFLDVAKKVREKLGAPIPLHYIGLR